ncbi:MAG TPA: hypothetical protein VJU87_10755 [Gemmatimonadaceae bacterium]|nr:hypothetical protein [Gemmatimonadaceae bacterium]
MAYEEWQDEQLPEDWDPRDPDWAPQVPVEHERRARGRIKYEVTAKGREALEAAQRELELLAIARAPELVRQRAIAEIEQRIIATEGVFYVCGRYYGSLGAADSARRIAAERMYRQAKRKAVHERVRAYLAAHEPESDGRAA